MQCSLVTAGGQVVIDFDALRHLEGRRTQLEAMEIWRMPDWQWCDRVEADPSLLTNVPEHLQVDIRCATVDELECLSREQLADLARAWNRPHSGTKARLIQEMQAAGALFRRLDSETEESLMSLRVPQLNDLCRKAGRGPYGNKASKARYLLEWRDQVYRKRLIYLARVVHAEEVRKARLRGERIPEYKPKLEPFFESLRARRIPPEEIERRVRSLYEGIPTQPGDVVTLADQPEALQGLTYEVEGETSRGLVVLRCRERPRWPKIQMHRCYLQRYVEGAECRSTSPALSAG